MAARTATTPKKVRPSGERLGEQRTQRMSQVRVGRWCSFLDMSQRSLKRRFSFFQDSSVGLLRSCKPQAESPWAAHEPREMRVESSRVAFGLFSSPHPVRSSLFRLLRYCR